LRWSEALPRITLQYSAQPRCQREERSGDLQERVPDGLVDRSLWTSPHRHLEIDRFLPADRLDR
jgi:hypothetical protein